MLSSEVEKLPKSVIKEDCNDPLGVGIAPSIIRHQCLKSLLSLPERTPLRPYRQTPLEETKRTFPDSREEIIAVSLKRYRVGSVTIRMPRARARERQKKYTYDKERYEDKSKKGDDVITHHPI